MCPVCVATMALMVAGAVSTGRAAVLVVKKFLPAKSRACSEGIVAPDLPEAVR